VIGQMGQVSHQLGSLLGAIEFLVLRALVCRVGYFDTQIRETLPYNREFDLLASLEKCNYG